ncbi:MAG: hypothetical protein RJB13_1369, partial [Pseudomonadota bacterium]
MRATSGRKFFQGIPICDGLAVGQLIVPAVQSNPNKSGLIVIAPDNEWEKYNQAKRRALDQIRILWQEIKTRENHQPNTGGRDLLGCYSSLIEDEVLVQKIRTLVFDDAIGAAEAVAKAFKDVRDVISSMQNPHIREKALDLDACEDMLLSELCNTHNFRFKNGAELKGKVVAVHQPHPQEIIQLHKAGIIGIIAETGSKLCHAAILAKSFNIPTVFGASGLIRAASKSSHLILDASTGLVSLNPSRSELRKAEARKAVSLMLQQKLKASAQSIARTQDGQRMLVFANAESLIDSRFYTNTGAEGIGLLRTEFLHLPSSENAVPSFVTSEESLKTYFQSTAEVSNGRWVTVRLLDCGGDKPFPANYTQAAKTSLNDSGGVFGLRGVRFLLSERSILQAQLRSIIRANASGNIRVLIPFVTDVDEIRLVKSQLRAVWEELTESERCTLHFPALGAMIETPAAVQLLDFITSECDFVSIGSNDLTQHLLCVERDKPLMAGQFS